MTKHKTYHTWGWQKSVIINEFIKNNLNDIVYILGKYLNTMASFFDKADAMLVTFW